LNRPSVCFEIIEKLSFLFCRILPPSLDVRAQKRLQVACWPGAVMNAVARECVLLLEGNEVDARIISTALMNGLPNALVVERVTKLHTALEGTRQGGVRAVILDIELPNGHGVATFEGLLSAAPHIPILILSGVENESVARQAVERGAHDYMLKSRMQTSRLRNTVQRMIERNTAEEKASSTLRICSNRYFEFLLASRNVLTFCNGSAWN
jgi:DNA-binding response OmpR family regulator